MRSSSYLITIIVALVVFICANIFFEKTRFGHSGANHETSEMKRYLDEIKTLGPEFVLIGNSMLGEGIDPNIIAKKTGMKVMKIARGGSASAWWFLTFKNVVVEAEKVPRTVVFFFRDSFLTLPKYRTGGKYLQSILEMSGKSEPIVDKLVFGSSLKGNLFRNIPLLARRFVIQEKVDDLLKNVLLARGFGLTPGEVDKSIGREFKESKMNKDLLNKTQLEMEKVDTKTLLDFEDQLEMSFLPSIIDLAAQNDIQLVFVRVKRRKNLHASDDQDKFADYIQNLKIYLNEKGCILLDYTGDPGIMESHFGVGDHLNRTSGRELFSSLVGKDLDAIITQYSR
ncbi:hypothetical protein [Desulfosediminicola flagellatus]|uniref:hypothetical protein n=1 Tax=Desulfosediminicola flagellatus TaxID=2569541 RepID=UPI0010AC2899|nr:hypothetical protein [Desulfosediminicola flagellatus]